MPVTSSTLLAILLSFFQTVWFLDSQRSWTPLRSVVFGILGEDVVYEHMGKKGSAIRLHEAQAKGKMKSYRRGNGRHYYSL